MKKTDPIYIVGPTAVGKTEISIALAQNLDAEIVSADSMQVYRGMNIGTAKPSASQLKQIPHHLINILNLDETFSAAKFKNVAQEIIADIRQHGHLSLVVGGTGLYVKSLTEGIFEGPSADWEYRATLQSQEEKHGSGYLYSELCRIDPVSAKRIKSNDMRRIERALEVYHIAGKPISEMQTEWEKKKPDITIIGLYMERGLLKERINKRVDDMFSQGLVEETRYLLKAGIESNRTAMQAIGYKEVIGYIHGEYPIEMAHELLKQNSRRYAKRQLTWFRKDGRIKWFDVGIKAFDRLLNEIKDYLKSQGY
jgi:tRNA dimethylallyltransferase